MKTCKGCKYAKWERTAAGKLHPGGDGRCEYPVTIQQLPQAFYFLGSHRPSGGRINRRDELNDHCAFYAPEK